MINPTIDPVTGLPVLNPQDVIQQIPLGVQTFPWQDLAATDRPTRVPIYGDDILPVSSFTTGQHPDTGSAQTVGTDGNHALKVFTVNEEGGGGGSWAGTTVNGSQEGSYGGASPSQPIDLNAYTSFILTDFSLSWYVDPTGLADGTNTLLFWYIGPGFGVDLKLGTDYMCNFKTAGNVHLGGGGRYIATHPIDLVASAGSSGDPLYLNFIEQHPTGATYYFVFYYTVLYTQ